MPAARGIIFAGAMDDKRRPVGVIYDRGSTFPISIERRPVSPREPITMVDASWRSAISRIVFQTGPVALTASGFGLHAGSSSDADALVDDAAAKLGGQPIELHVAEHVLGLGADQAKLPRPAVGPPHASGLPHLVSSEQARRHARSRAWQARIRRSREAMGCQRLSP